MNQNQISFLTPTLSSIRRSIRGIDDSYNNFWDILAEVVQNSVDAINAKEEKKGKILLEINALEKSVHIIDDGIGMDHDMIPVLLSPFSTSKENDMNSIGEKGVGLKFVIFQSDNFLLKTKKLNAPKTSIAKIENAKTWKNSNSEEDLHLKLEYTDELIEGTDILISGIDNDKIFEMNYDTMKFIVRTKTAIGNVLNIFEDQPNIEVTLKMTDLNGEVNEEIIPYKYWLPIENVKETEKINLKDYQKWVLEEDRSDQEKRNKLKNKIIYETGNIIHNDTRNIRYWLCFVPKRRVWEDLSVQDKLLREEMLNDEESLREKNLCMHQAGIFTSVKGMPTGITISHPTTGNAGYWANIFVILEDKQLKFDIGRKSINGFVQAIYQKHLKEKFNKITNLVSKYIAGDPETVRNPSWDRDNIKTEIDALPPLNSGKVNFLKLPNEQEASVAAIFYELVGKGTFENFNPIISGYKSKYDLYAQYKNHFIVMEFKSHLRNIIRDFDDLVKMFNEIDYIVCWDVNDDDKTDLHNNGLTLEMLNQSELFQNNEGYMKATTHQLIIASSVKPIYIIDLKMLIRSE